MNAAQRNVLYPRAYCKPLHRTHKRALAAVTLALFVHHASAESNSFGAEIDQHGGSQNTAEITQTGAPQAYGYIAQDGHLNTGIILQSGPADEIMSASISQFGSSQFAIIEQDDVEDRAIGEVVQTGVNNSTNAVQSGVMDVSFRANQDGESNTVTLYQSHWQANADVAQKGFGNDARVEQVGRFFLTEATIYQEGSENRIHVLQEEESGGTVTSEQIGNRNVAFVHQWQEGPPNSVSASLVTEGDDNVVLVDQRGSGDGRFELMQSGNLNYVELRQRGDGAAAVISSHASNNNEDVVDQLGVSINVRITRNATEHSRTLIDQDGMASSIFIEQANSQHALATVQQMGGAGHEASIRQLHVLDSTAEVVQRPDYALAKIEQSGTVDTTASVYQSGSVLSAVVNQSDSVNALADVRQIASTSDSAEVWQDGVESTEAYLFQAAEGYGSGSIGQSHVSDSVAQIEQYQARRGGTSLVASIYQADGADLLADIEQTGEYNEAVINQINSTHSEAYITQHAVSAYAEINQINGCHNTATITQGYENYSATITQGSNNNTAAITQF